ncbi:DUF2092 domain-containing protein [Algoriphagus aestuariicola]|jgi:hypothetical protein|uniref:DUF2092 domain-containing protein n=1 Tax=Algoriphagus aestuariicola TaxID=1852016 RepID=A0ABS3BSG2_9BACT|nr:DUF2092 domain-containing protein [Algoriphagus aestuariicola]MBN7802012.1 DUF2092 domain-containing protein [Algoriphagus aestuariicola]
MLKKICLGLALIVTGHFAKAQEGKIDSTAMMILDKMSGLFGELKSVGFTSEVAKDVVYSEDFFIKEFGSSKVRFLGPNKFSVRISGEKQDDLYSYNGSQVAYYSFANNLYAVADAPDNLIETIDWLYEDFGVELTLADLFYPSFSQDFADKMDYVEFLGVIHIDGVRTFHIGAANENATFQFWISDDGYFLPKKILITYMDGPYAHQHQTDFYDWELNQDLPESIFEFLPPPNAKQITWIKKN